MALLLPLTAGTAQQASAEGSAADLTVVELFTSQGCYSCPPAEALLGELVERSDVVALEFHVDYWDDLVYGSAGRWKDPFSSRKYTERQQFYARRLGSNRVYTPQMVVDGHIDVVGSRRSQVLGAIDDATRERNGAARLALTGGDGAEVALTLDGEIARQAEVWLVSFEQAHVTRVSAGENKGKTLANHHVVTEITQIANWRGGPLTLTLDRLPQGANQGCAVLVQEALQGPMLAASYCP